MVGGRLGYFAFYSPSTFYKDPLDLFKVWTGGMSSHGGFIGILLGLWWASRKHSIPWLRTGDIVCTLGPPGVMLGRIANFLNQELWGNVTTVSWGVIFPKSAPPGTPIELIPARHPSQLYEAALEGLLLTIATQLRIWITPKVLATPGRLAGEFLLAYAIVRIFGEQFREHDPGIMPVLGLNRGAWLSMGLAAGGIALIIHSLWKQRKSAD
jgi:phosphatidylglycerol:prolipoprotein diacylglycerol transferase